MPWAIAIPIAMAAAGTASSVIGGIGQGQAAQTAGHNQAKQAQLDASKNQLNAVLMTYEANRVRDELRLDTTYLGWATERQAKWLATQAELDKSIALGRVADQFTRGADEAKARGADAIKAAEIQADSTEKSGARKAAQISTQTNIKRVMQQEEDAKALGLLRAKAGARMVAYTGSALDVLAHEEAMANARQVAVAVLGGMQADDVQYDSRIQANITRQRASMQAQAEYRQFTDNPLDNPVLQAQLVKADIGTQRDIALTQEEGWRTIMKMKMGEQQTQTKITMGIGEQMMGASSNLGASVSYRIAGDNALSASYFKAGTSLLTGSAEIFKQASSSGMFAPKTADTTGLSASSNKAWGNTWSQDPGWQNMNVPNAGNL